MLPPAPRWARQDVPTDDGASVAVPAQDKLEQRRRSRLRALVAATESEGARLQFWARSASLFAIAVVFAAISRMERGAGLRAGRRLFVFFLSGLINYWLARPASRPSWFVFATGTLDIVLLTILIVTPNPFAEYNQPAGDGPARGRVQVSVGHRLPRRAQPVAAAGAMARRRRGDLLVGRRSRGWWRSRARSSRTVRRRTIPMPSACGSISIPTSSISSSRRRMSWSS